MAKSGIEAYNMSKKVKEELSEVVISKNGNRCMAKGVFKSGSTGCVTIGLANSEAAIKEGRASKGDGWDN
jgi:hypothetical protein